MKTGLIQQLSSSAHQELYGNIVPFWIKYSRDQENGGFYGRIHNNLEIERTADKGLVLNARILWTFSAILSQTSDSECLKMAERAYQYIVDRFWDKKYNGCHWMLDYKGEAINSQKKLYGQAFTVYALAEYYHATRFSEALDLARKIFSLIEAHDYDSVNRGYLQPSDSDWSLITNTGPAESDIDEKKSMNAHLHLMEAYASLYRVWPDELLKKRLGELIDLHLQIIIDRQTYHLIMVFDELWQAKSKVISYGHDIEGSWLLCEAAEILGVKSIGDKVRTMALKMVDAVISEGLSKKFFIFHERDENGVIHEQTDWWQQAESVVGLINAWQVTKKDRYLDLALKMWQVIEQAFVDRQYGEWFYSIKADGKPDLNQFKVSEWKGPYHNVRTCLEMMRRLKS
jgi:mannobiose 2-epimerase